jgi:D-alanyl-D-alanine carboxypeptidase
MNRSMILKLAVSGLVLSFATSGCSGAPAGRVASASKPIPSKPVQAAKAAEKARELLAAGKTARALGQAELAVSLDNQDGGHRALLGQTYLSSGRFASAATAFEDAISLGIKDPQTVIGLVLAKIASGDQRAALALIEEHRESVPASDAGLAQALAGDTQRAIYTLTEAAKQPDAGARTRQNLALALALSGRWAQSRIVASQDLSPAKLDARMGEWATMAQQSLPAYRVASLIGVKPVADNGMPVRLALVTPEAPVALAAAAAAADPAPLAEFAPPPPPPVAVAAAVESIAQPAIRSVELPMPTSQAAVAEAQLILADKTPYRVAPRVAGAAAPVRTAAVAAPVKPLAAAPAERPAATEARALAARVAAPRARSFDAKKPSGWAVQLGAFDTLGIAKEKWATLSRANSELGAFPASSQSASVNGRAFYRLTVNGLASRAEAMELCATLKASGQGCFVRSMNPGEKVQWAAKPSVRLASR